MMITLSEGATHADKSTNLRKACFTLAEVLITLGIIGVVAALTLPVLSKNISQKVELRQKQVIEKKLIDGLNMLNSQENGLTHSYTNTEEFVKALSKYMKVIQICGKDNLQDCFPYEYINEYEGSGKIQVSNLKTPLSSMNLANENFQDTAGFITANGVPFIISYKQNCNQDPDSPLKVISDCVAGIYDLNGGKGPNRTSVSEYSKTSQKIIQGDIKEFNGARIRKCPVKINNICYTSLPFKVNPISISECEEFKQKLGILECSKSNDYWASGLKTCYEQNAQWPTFSQIAGFASFGLPRLKEIFGIEEDTFNIWWKIEFWYSPLQEYIGWRIEYNSGYSNNYRNTGNTKNANNYNLCVEK